MTQTIKENETLQRKLNTQNSSFINEGASDAEFKIMKADYERDIHKWQAEKTQLQA